MIVYPHSYFKNPKTVQYASSSISSTNATQYTFSNMNYIGPGYIVVGTVSQVATGALTAGSCTLGGVSMTNLGTSTFLSAPRIRMTFWGLQVNSGTQANIVWTSPSPTCLNCGIGVWRCQNVSGVSPSSTFQGTATPSATLTNTVTNGSNGGVIISMISQSITTAQASSDQIWTNVKTQPNFYQFVSDLNYNLSFGGTSCTLEESGNFTLQGFSLQPYVQMIMLTVCLK